MSRIVTFGEIMMRLNPPGYQKLIQASSLEVSFAGGEANVCVSLANYGQDASFVTKVPAHEIGQCAVNALRRYGVDTRGMLRGGERLGTYYVEKGASQRGSKVIYDRTGSAIALARREEFDWDSLLEGAEWFHFTGITPALGGELPAICLDAVKAARARGVTVSCDLNYRSKLWSREEAGQVMATLMPYVDVCIANEEDAKDVFSIAAKHTDVTSGKLDKDGYVSVARQLQERFDFKCVAITLRGSISASDNNWSGMLYDADGHYLGHYGESYAVAENIFGPYKRYAYNPILHHHCQADGAGDGIVIYNADRSEMYMGYHRHYSCEEVEPRMTCLDPMRFVPDPDGGPDILTVRGPSTVPQPIPFRHPCDENA